jgi:Sec-independent protein translocase protein TatA
MATEDIVKGFVVGIGVALAVPLLLGSSRAKVLGKAAIRAGEQFAEKAQDFAAELGEIAEDTLAEWEQTRPDDAEQQAATKEDAAA